MWWPVGLKSQRLLKSGFVMHENNGCWFVGDFCEDYWDLDGNSLHLLYQELHWALFDHYKMSLWINGMEDAVFQWWCTHQTNFRQQELDSSAWLTSLHFVLPTIYGQSGQYIKKPPAVCLCQGTLGVTCHGDQTSDVWEFCVTVDEWLNVVHGLPSTNTQHNQNKGNVASSCCVFYCPLSPIAHPLTTDFRFRNYW